MSAAGRARTLAAALLAALLLPPPAFAAPAASPPPSGASAAPRFREEAWRERYPLDPPPDGRLDPASRAYWLPWYLTHPGEEAVSFFRAAAASHTGEAGLAGRLAVALFQAGHYDECLALAERVQADAPGEPWSLFARALALQDRNESEGALEAFSRLRDADLAELSSFYLTPGMLRMHRASLHLKLGRTAEAELCAAEGRAFGEAGDLPALKLVESFYLKISRVDAAVGLWEAILARDPGDLNARVNLASILARSTIRRDPARARRLLAEVGPRGERFVQVHYFRFLAAHRAGDRAGADAALAACSAMEPETQERLEIENDELATDVTATQVFITAFLCRGEWARMTALIERDLARLHETSALLKEDLFPFVPDYETFDYEAMFRYHAAGHPEERPPDSPFFRRFEAAFIPAAPAAAAALAEAAALKAAGRLADAGPALARGLAAEPGALALLILAHERALAARDLPGCRAALLACRAVRADPDRDPAAALARLFAMTVTLDPFWIYDRGEGGVRRYERTTYTRDLDETRFGELRSVYDELRDGLAAIAAGAESESARTVANLLSAYVAWCLNRLPEMRRSFLAYVALDPDYRVLRALYVRFAKR